jgi:hypothetical protein
MSGRGSHGHSEPMTPEEDRILLAIAMAESMATAVDAACRVTPSARPPRPALSGAPRPAPSSLAGLAGASSATPSSALAGAPRPALAPQRTPGSSSSASSSSASSSSASSSSAPPTLDQITPELFVRQFPPPLDEPTQARQVYGDFLEDVLTKKDAIIAETKATVNISRIIPPTREKGGLYHSNAVAAANRQILEGNRITLIIQSSNIADEKAAITRTLQTMPKETRPSILELDMEDNETQSFTNILNKTLFYEPFGQLPLLRLMRKVRGIGGNILVNCSIGMSRSTAIVLMHLMDPLGENMSLLNAWRFLKMKRPMIFPNVGFLEKLMAYENRTRGELTVSHKLYKMHPVLQMLDVEDVKPLNTILTSTGGYRKNKTSKKRNTKKSAKRR